MNAIQYICLMLVVVMGAVGNMIFTEAWCKRIDKKLDDKR